MKHLSRANTHTTVHIRETPFFVLSTDFKLESLTGCGRR